MDCRIADAIQEDDSISYSLKTENQKFAFLMSSGVSPENPKFVQWRPENRARAVRVSRSGSSQTKTDSG